MKAVITTGGKQYLVAKDDVIEVELVSSDSKKLSFEPLLLINDKDVIVGTPTVSGHSVEVEMLETVKADKVVAIRYKAKKRVKKVHGHRQQLSKIKVLSIK